MEAIRSKPNHLRLSCFLALNIADSMITWQGVSMGASEVNWYNFLLGAMPIWAVLVIKMAIAGLLGFLVYRHRESLFKFLNLGMTLIVVFNLISLIVTRVLS